MLEARSWSDTLLCAADREQDTDTVFAQGGRRRLPVTKVRSLVTRKINRGAHPSSPLS